MARIVTLHIGNAAPKLAAALKIAPDPNVLAAQAAGASLQQAVGTAAANYVAQNGGSPAAAQAANAGAQASFTPNTAQTLHVDTQTGNVQSAPLGTPAPKSMLKPALGGLAGAGAGFWAGGPIGALIGGAIGVLVGKKV